MDLIVKIKFGAHLYGTATENSDIDYKGVFLPSKEEILLGTVPKCRSFSTKTDDLKNEAADVDEEIYSLHYFIKLACDGQTVAMDMLHAPDDMIIATSSIWRAIVSERRRFYTRSLKSFITYARRQASKYGIKGGRLNAASQVLDVLKSVDPESRLRTIWDRLPRIPHCHDAGIDPNGMRQYQVCGKIFQESAAVGYVVPILEKFRSDYGRRAKQAAENRNIDWKAVSHALRAALQTEEIMTRNTITFPLKAAPFLRQVKEGRLDYTTEVAPVLDNLMDDVEKLVDKSDLPDHVDRAYWRRFLCDTLERERFSKGDSK